MSNTDYDQGSNNDNANQNNLNDSYNDVSRNELDDTDIDRKAEYNNKSNISGRDDENDELKVRLNRYLAGLRDEDQTRYRQLDEKNKKIARRT